MAKLIEILDHAKIQNVVVEAENLLKSINYNPQWEDTFENGFKNFKRNHCAAEYTAFKVAVFNHTFWCSADEISVIPISTDIMVKNVEGYDPAKQGLPKMKVIPSSFVI